MFLLFIDIDKIKWINDNFGHQEGDKLLIDTANILKRQIRGADILARIVGDEFVALIDKTRDDLDEMIAKRLDESIRIYNAEGTRRFKLSLSIGFAYYDPTSPRSINELLDDADNKMYEQKQKKNNIKS